MFFKRIADYLNPVRLFRRERETNINLRMMHGINRISVWVFLVCLGIMIWRYFSR